MSGSDYDETVKKSKLVRSTLDHFEERLDNHNWTRQAEDKSNELMYSHPKDSE